MDRPVTGPDGDNPITDEQIRELYASLRVRDPMRRTCLLALSTDANRRYSHESGKEYRERKAKRAAALERCAAAWNARHVKEVDRG